jgi:hypothetical protein
MTRQDFGRCVAGCRPRCWGSESRDWGHPHLPDRQAALVKGRQRRQDHRPHRLVLALGLDRSRERQRLRGVRLAGYRPNQDLQLRAGQI